MGRTVKAKAAVPAAPVLDLMGTQAQPAARPGYQGEDPSSPRGGGSLQTVAVPRRGHASILPANA
jgi:hypothetical protein